MDQKMFCFPTAPMAKLQDELTGALIGLARATDNCPAVNEGTWQLMIQGLFTTIPNADSKENTLEEFIHRIHQEKFRLVPDCSSCASPCGRTSDYDMKGIWNAKEDIRSLKSQILFGIRDMAAYAHPAFVLGYSDPDVNHFFAKALFALGEDWNRDYLLAIVKEAEDQKAKCKALLNKAKEAK